MACPPFARSFGDFSCAGKKSHESRKMQYYFISKPLGFEI